jgi:3-oxoadipate enol-lactonase
MATGAADLFVDDRGAGSAVVLLHGTPSDPEDFRPLADALARRHRVLLPHWPGYGRTPASAVAPIIEGVAQFAEQLERTGVSEAAVVGFSGGAYRALALALGGRLRVTRLVLISPTVGLDPPVAQAYRAIAAAARAGAYDPRPTWLDRMAGPGLAARDPAGAARVLAWLDAVPGPVLCDELVAFADAPDLRPRWIELSCPLLVLAGAADRAIAPGTLAEIAAARPRATAVAIEGAGHALLIEAPERVVPRIVDFLEAKDPDANDDLSAKHDDAAR